MKAAELEAVIEARVGRGRWFVASELLPADLLGRNQHPRNTLISRGVLERRELGPDDPRRSVTSTRFEYRLVS